MKMEVKFESIENEPDAFNLYEDETKIGEMIIEVNEGRMTVFHTEIDEDKGGNGYAKLLLEAMVKYAREHHLKVIPMCAYVRLQFNRYPDQYKDIR